MKVPIVYFSSSGNTKYIAELITKGLLLANHDPQLIPWTSFKSDPIDIQDYDAFGIGAPIYALSYPPFIISWIKSISTPKRKQSFFLFDTSSGLPGNALEKTGNILEDKGYRFLGALEIISPTRDSVFQSSYFDYVSWSRRKLNKSLQFGIKVGTSLRIQNPTILDWTIKKMPFANFIRKGFQYLEEFYFQFIGKSIKVDPSKCTNCKVCSKACPTNAIEMDQCPTVNPDLCIGCFKCLRECPVGALYLKQFPHADYFEGPQKIEGYIPPKRVWDKYLEKFPYLNQNIR